MKRVLAIVLAGGMLTFAMQSEIVARGGGGGGGRGGGGGGGGGAAVAVEVPRVRAEDFLLRRRASRPAPAAPVRRVRRVRRQPVRLLGPPPAAARRLPPGPQAAAARKRPPGLLAARQRRVPQPDNARPPVRQRRIAPPAARPTAGQLNNFLDVPGAATGAVGSRRCWRRGCRTSGRRSRRFPARREARNLRREPSAAPRSAPQPQVLLQADAWRRGSAWHCW